MQNLKQPLLLGVVLLAAFFFVPLQPGRAQVLVAGGSEEPTGSQTPIFVSATGQFPPSPFNPLPDLPLLGDDPASNQVFVVDDRDFDFSANWAEVARANNGGMVAMDDSGPPTPDGGTNSNSGGGGTNYFAKWTTNDLWLEIVSETDQAAAFIIHQPWNTPTNAVYGLYCTTNLAAPVWQWVLCTAPGQTNMLASGLPIDLGFFRLGAPTAIRPGFDQQILPPNDDGSTDLVDIGFPVNFFGTSRTQLYVNNNGNVSFDNPLGTYTPTPIIQEAINNGTDLIAPYWADVATWSYCPRSLPLTYGSGTVDGYQAFGVDWIDVGYFENGDDKLNTFQLVFVDRSDRANGDYDVEFNYAQVQWETGDASGGSDGLGGSPVRIGFATINNVSSPTFEMAGSGTSLYFLDTNPADGTLNPTGIIYSNFNSTVPGRYVFQFHNGAPMALPPGSTDAQQLLQSAAQSRMLMYLPKPENN